MENSNSTTLPGDDKGTSSDESYAPLPPRFVHGLELAIACFTLGFVALPLAIIPVFIALAAALPGIVLAIIHLRKRMICKNLVKVGLVFSIVAVVGSGVSFIISQRTMAQFEFPEDEALISEVGAEAPDFTVTDLDGNDIVLSDLHGKVVILDFWATWCQPCVMAIPHLIALVNTTQPDDLVIIGIADQPAEILRDFAAENDINYPIVSQRKQMMPPYGNVRAYPTVFFIDGTGRIRDIQIGYQDFTELKKIVSPLLDELAAVQ